VVLLQDEPHLPAQVPVVERLQVHAVVEDGALAGLEQPGQALDQRRLAGAAAPDDRHGLARGHLEADPFQDAGRLGAAVVERETPQLHLSFERLDRLQARVVGPLLWLVLEHVVQAVEQDG